MFFLPTSWFISSPKVLMSLESTKVRSLSVAFCLPTSSGRPKGWGDVQSRFQEILAAGRRGNYRVILDPPRTQQMVGDCMSCRYRYSYSHLVRVLCRWNPTARHLKSRIYPEEVCALGATQPEFDHKKSSPLKILIPQPF